MSLPLDEIKAAINKWDIIRTPEGPDFEAATEIIVNYLKQGFCFETLEADYESWKGTDGNPNPEYIHAYLGIYGEELVFFLIDSIADKTGDFSNILVKDYLKASSILLTIIPPPPKNIADELETNSERLRALETCFQWQMYCKTWTSNVLHTDDRQILQIMRIPFEDFENAFEGNEYNVAASYFALKVDETENVYNIDMYTSAIDLIPQLLSPTDRCRPMPPFKPVLDPIDDFQLYIESST